MTFSPIDLQHLAVIQTAICVCNDPIVKIMEERLETPLYLLTSESLKQCIKVKTPPKVPQTFEGELMKLLRPISLEIERWKEDHSRIIDTRQDFTNYFVWKNLGVIDKQATARALIESDRLLDVKHRFALACFYCFEDSIMTLWQEISPLGKTRIICRSEIVRVWKYHLESGREVNDEFYFWALRDDNPSATCYLLSKLTPEECDTFLRDVPYKTFPISNNVLVFCYTQMDDNSQAIMLERHPLKMLLWFLNWPLQSLFLRKMDTAYEYLSEKEFQSILLFILLERILTEWHDFDYVHILKRFWNQSPSKFKRYVLQGIYGRMFQKILDHDWTESLPKNFLPYSVQLLCSQYRLKYVENNYKLRRKTYIDLVAGNTPTFSG
ncbi:uncharacterized protein TNIN_176111 [Trichonephila inaurata madagascariensis]|uniref:Uncharacterized protein n=1 Tax=Trichonephila inaurata madagascariensis TaxID=2747483 RepID=A0A8X6JVW6_9ARAC|nr:uncharacterized protein TNIN_176111 [Trichonephila inaurata madagascariensis]